MGLHCLVRAFLQEEDPMTFFFSQTLGLKTRLLGTPENTHPFRQFQGAQRLRGLWFLGYIIVLGGGHSLIFMGIS